MPKAPALELIPLRAGAFGGETLPSRIKLLEWGLNDTRKGKFVVNETTALVLPRLQCTNKRQRVAIDFEHNTVPRKDAAGNSLPTPEPQKLAAWGTPEVIPGEGLFLSDLEWLAAGQEFVPDHYPDLSAAPWRNEKNEVVCLHSAAVCRHGEVDGITVLPISLNTTMDNTETAPDFRALLASIVTALGGELPEDFTDTDLAAAAVAAAEKAKPEPEKKEETTEEEPAALSAFATRLDSFERRMICDQAKREGKVIPLPDSEIQALPLATLSSMVANLAPTVPIRGADHTATVPDTLSTTPAMSAEDKAVAKRLGISEDTWKKHNAAR